MKYVFRGKDKKGRWNYGDLINKNSKKYIGYFISHEDEQFSYLNDYVMNEVIPETVGQYTGENALQKEKIYEGSIIRNFNQNSRYFNHVGYIVRRKGSYQIKYVTGEEIDKRFVGYIYVDISSLGCLIMMGHLEGIEVIGNIHDNKELLK